MQTITNIDLRLLNWIHEHLACSFLDFLMPKITFLGNGGLIWIAAAIIMIFFKKYRKIGIMIGTGLSAGVIIGNILLKNLIARERPCWINETVQMLISTPQDYSFPSGHTLSSFVAATIIMHHDKRLGIAAYVFCFNNCNFQDCILRSLSNGYTGRCTAWNYNWVNSLQIFQYSFT